MANLDIKIKKIKPKKGDKKGDLTVTSNNKTMVEEIEVYW